MKIAILSNGPGNYSTQRLAEEARKRGHYVKVVKYKNCYAAVEKNNPIVRYKGQDLRKFDAIIPRIASNMTRYGTAIVRQFEMRGVFTTASSIAIARSRDKLRTLQIFARSGIEFPKTVFARNTSDLDTIISEIGEFPMIIKLASGTHGSGVILAETKKAAKSVMQTLYVMSNDGTNILLQEFIKESVGTDIRAFVVDGKVVASMQRKSLDDDFRSNLHQGGQGTPIELTPEEEKTALRAAKSMGLPICGVDLMRSNRGPLVLEVNASPGFGIEKVTSKNVAEKIIEYVEQNIKSKRRKDKVGA